MTPNCRHTTCAPAVWLCCVVLSLACGTPTATTPDENGQTGDTAAGDIALTDTKKPDTATPDVVAVDVDTADLGSSDVDQTDAAADGDGGVDSVDAPDTVLNCPGAAWCPCTSNGECETGKCLDTPDGQKCAPTCTDTGCPAGYACKLVGAQDPLSYCVSTQLSLCAPCVTNKDCQAQGVTSALCLDYGDDGHFCGGACTTSSDCGDG